MLLSAVSGATLIDAAEELLANGPFASVRIEDIADGADMSVGAVYGHFENTNGL
ncbi:helix-turn-helix domain-containing protein [Rhodococcus sp. Leaf278]|uniref:helix-turn-helix domain-containing protein n=1 Tax=Rhodococcus sp. Leaf278 TaxID=1736319 RepID=UPI00138F061B|nr:helix-turn-helix domain-containing protein [Rhodococcus sp. Leaf278]